jgi:hypothetical protein
MILKGGVIRFEFTPRLLTIFGEEVNESQWILKGGVIRFEFITLGFGVFVESLYHSKITLRLPHA